MFLFLENVVAETTTKALQNNKKTTTIVSLKV